MRITFVFTWKRTLYLCGMAKKGNNNIYFEAYIVFMWRGFSNIFYMKVPDFSYIAMNNVFHSPPWSMHLPNLSIL